jgi:hypothetical protein
MTDTIKLRAVVEGDAMVAAVEGGVIRRPAPGDGVVVDCGESEIFLPEDKVTEALRQLARRRGHRAADRKPGHKISPAQMNLPGDTKNELLDEKNENRNERKKSSSGS